VSSTAGHQFVSGRRTAAAGDGDYVDHTVVKHVMVDNTEVARKAWHRTIFGREQA
jgi:hypothetical protein